MDKFFHSRFFRFLVCLLLVLAFLVNCSPIRARAVAAETFMVTLEAFISACLIGLGLSPQVGNYSPFNQVVSDCKDYLQTATVDGLEIVSSGSQLMLALTYPGQGSYYVRKIFLDTIKDWLFDSGTISSYRNTFIESSGTFTFDSYSVSYYDALGTVYGEKLFFFNGSGYTGGVFLYSGSSFRVSSGSLSSSHYSAYGVELYKLIAFATSYDQFILSGYHYYPGTFEDYYALMRDALAPSLGLDSSSFPDGISVSDVVPQVGEDIDITYIDWKELEKQLNEVGSDGEGDDSEDPTNPIIHIPYWPIWSPQFSDPDATLDDVTQLDVWTKGSSSTWDPSDTGTSTGSDTSGSWSPSSDMGHFTLDLKEYFPFCIPFDLYDFFTCLNAAPVAPVIEWVIPMPGGGTYPMEIDLSVFDSVAQLLRRLQLLMFCVGLAFKTRDLIKG